MDRYNYLRSQSSLTDDEYREYRDLLAAREAERKTRRAQRKVQMDALAEQLRKIADAILAMEPEQ